MTTKTGSEKSKMITQKNKSVVNHQPLTTYEQRTSSNPQGPAHFLNKFY